MTSRTALKVVVVLALAMMSAGVAAADTFNIVCITNNWSGCGAVASQFSVTVLAGGSGTVTFTFSNTGSTSSAISDIYWDDAAGVLGAFTTSQFPVLGSGIAFDTPASPGDLPGGNTISPAFTSDFSVDSNAPAQPNGVNPGESVTISFTLAGSQTFQDVINAINNGTLRMGLHVQGLPLGQSDSFVNTPNNPVPEPTSLLLFGSGLLALGGVIRRRR